MRVDETMHMKSQSTIHLLAIPTIFQRAVLKKMWFFPPDVPFVSEGPTLDLTSRAWSSTPKVSTNKRRFGNWRDVLKASFHRAIGMFSPLPTGVMNLPVCYMFTQKDNFVFIIQEH